MKILLGNMYFVGEPVAIEKFTAIMHEYTSRQALPIMPGSQSRYANKSVTLEWEGVGSVTLTLADDNQDKRDILLKVELSKGADTTETTINLADMFFVVGSPDAIQAFTAIMHEYTSRQALPLLPGYKDSQTEPLATLTWGHLGPVQLRIADVNPDPNNILINVKVARNS